MENRSRLLNITSIAPAIPVIGIGKIHLYSHTYQPLHQADQFTRYCKFYSKSKNVIPERLKNDTVARQNHNFKTLELNQSQALRNSC